jgi:ubiquinone/menaquinone biosynthesis C-methylase UbiE
VVRARPGGVALAGVSPRLDGLADAYSQTGAAWQAGPGRVYDRLADELVARAPASLADRTVLDVGAGTGAASRAIVRAGGHPFACDLAPGMLAAMAAEGWPGVAADARALPLGTRSVGAVVAAFSYNHVPEPALALAEARRVVAPGGAVLASAYASDDDHPVKAAVDAAERESGWEPAPWVTAMRSSAAPLLATVERAAAAAAAAGLEHTTVDHIEVPFPELGAEDLVAWRMGMAQLAPHLAARPEADRAVIAARALELLGDAPPLVRRMIVIAAVV